MYCLLYDDFSPLVLEAAASLPTLRRSGNKDDAYLLLRSDKVWAVASSRVVVLLHR